MPSLLEIDRLLEMLAAHDSPQARLRSNEPMQIWPPVGWASADYSFVGGQLNRMLGLVAPPEVRAFVHDLNAQYEFDYFHQSGLYRVEVEAVNGQRTVFVTRLDENGLPLRPRDNSHDAAGSSTNPQPLPSEGVPAPEAAPTQWKLKDEPLPAPAPQPPPKRTPAPRTVATEQATTTPAPSPAPTTVPSPSSAPTSQSSPQKPVGTETAHWFYGHAGQSMGPHTKEEMASLIATGALLRETMVFDSRVGDWQQAKLSALSGFFPLKTEGEWVNPSVQNWRPQTAGEAKAEKAFVGLIGTSVVGVILFVVGWIAVAQMRGSNRSFDYSKEFAQTIEKKSPASTTGALHNVHLEKDEKNLKRYFGSAQYATGYLADVEFNVLDHDFWERPTDTDFSATPHDFTPEVQNQVRGKINTDLAAQEVKLRAEFVTLTHGQGNSYSGTVRFDDRSVFPVTAEVLGFNTDGSLQGCSYHIQN